MGSLTNYAEQKMLDHLCLTPYSSVATLYLGLSTADPTDAATGASCNEVPNAYDYARTAITFGAAGSRLITQNADVDFPAANGGSWGTVTHWFVADNATYGAGNVLAAGAFGTSKTINDGNTPSVASGVVYVSISAGEVSDYAANAFLDRMFRNQAFTISANYLALIITNATDDADDGDTITEPSGGSYARKQVNANGGAAPDWDLAVAGDPSYVDSADAITFATATASWGTVIGVALCDALTSGEVLMYDNAMTDQLVDDGDTAEFAAAAIVLQMN